MDFFTSKRVISTALVFLVVLNVTLLSLLWWQHTRRHEPGAGAFGRQFNHQPSFTEPLALSESQTVSFRKLRQEHFQKVWPEMQAIALLKKQLLEESLNDKPDTQKIDSLADSIGSRQATIERELAAHFHELAKICKPEQRDSLKKVLEHVATRKLSNRKEQWGLPLR